MTEEEYIVVSDLQRLRYASQMLRDTSSRLDFAEIIDKVEFHISTLEKRVGALVQ